MSLFNRHIARFFGIAALLLQLGVATAYAQLDYNTPETSVQQAQPATPAPATQAPAATPVQPSGSVQVVSQPQNGGTPTWAYVVMFVLLVLVVVLFLRRRTNKGDHGHHDHGDGRKEPVPAGLNEGQVRAIVTGMLPKTQGLTAAEVEALVKKLMPATLSPVDIEALVKKILAAQQPPPPPAEVKVKITPEKVRLSASQSANFKAEVTGTENKAVTWSHDPAFETFGKFVHGTFTAPSMILQEVTVTVTATSVADPSKSATAEVYLSPAKATKHHSTPPVSAPPATPPATPAPTKTDAPPPAPKATGRRAIGFIATMICCVALVSLAGAQPRCYNPATAPKGVSPAAGNSIPLAVTGVAATMSCPGMTGAVEVSYLNGTVISSTGSPASFTFTPPTHGRARIKVGGVIQSILVIEDGPDAVRMNGAVDLARVAISGAASSGGGSDEKLFKSFLRGLAQQYGLNERQLLSMLTSPKPGTSRQVAALIQGGITNAVFADPRIAALKARADAAQAKADEAEALAAKAGSGGTPGTTITDDHIRGIAHTEAVAVVAPVKAVADEANYTAGYVYDRYGQLVRVVAGMNGVKDPASQRSKSARAKTLGGMLRDLHCADPSISDGERKKFGCPKQ